MRANFTRKSDLMFAENLRKIRKERGFTQLGLAEAIGVASGTVAMWETGKRETSFDILIKISKVLNVSIDYLLTCTEFKETIHKKRFVIIVDYIEIKEGC